jgi:hypothetical protein
MKKTSFEEVEGKRLMTGQAGLLFLVFTKLVDAAFTRMYYL